MVLTRGRTLCLYHYPCSDGIFGALAVHLAHKAQGINVDFLPNAVYAALTVEGLGLKGDETAYLVDFAGPPGFARQLSGACARVVVLDHHKTAAAELLDPALASVPGLEVNFDMERSGATLSLAYFQPGGLSSNQQRLFQYIEDADLWHWKLPNSKAFTAGLASLNYNYNAQQNPAIFDQLLALTPEQLIAQGQPLLAVQQTTVDAAMQQSFVVRLGGGAGTERGWGACLAVKVDAEVARLRSQLGNRLAEESRRRGLRAMAIVAYMEWSAGNPYQIKCSLRSLGKEDTTVISQAYGGGGHLNASSFMCSTQEFDGWRSVVQ